MGDDRLVLDRVERASSTRAAADHEELEAAEEEVELHAVDAVAEAGDHRRHARAPCGACRRPSTARRRTRSKRRCVCCARGVPDVLNDDGSCVPSWWARAPASAALAGASGGGTAGTRRRWRSRSRSRRRRRRPPAIPSMSCCVFDPGLAHMSARGGPGARRGRVAAPSTPPPAARCCPPPPPPSASGGRRRASPSTRPPRRQPAPRPRRRPPRRHRRRPPPPPPRRRRRRRRPPPPRPCRRRPPPRRRRPSAPPLPRSTARETLKRHAGHPGYQPIGSGGGTRSPSSARPSGRQFNSIDARSATAPESAWPMMRKAMPSGRLAPP